MVETSTYQYPILPDDQIIEILDCLGIHITTEQLNNPDSKIAFSTFLGMLNASIGTSGDEFCVCDQEQVKKYGMDGNPNLVSAISLYVPL